MTKLKMLLAVLPFALIAFLVAPQAGCLGRGEDTPEEAFEKAKQLIQKGKYDEVWSLYSTRLHDTISQSYKRTKANLAKDPVNHAEHERLIREQHGMGYDEFIASNPRKLHATYLARHRDFLLGWEIVGEARIDGDHATLSVRTRPDYPSGEWRLVKTDGGWLIDETPTGAVDSTQSR